MNEWDMQHRLWCYFGQQWEMGVPNIYVWTWECDVLALSRRGYLTEYEIKVSVADYKQDHKKRKHWFLTNGTGGPSRFYYVIPKEIQEKVGEVPVHAGLIVIHDWRVHIVKRAPRIHNKQAQERTIRCMQRSIYHKAWDARNTVVRLQTEKRMQKDVPNKDI